MRDRLKAIREAAAPLAGAAHDKPKAVPGFVASLRLLLISNSETYWASTDWLLESGGVM